MLNQLSGVAVAMKNDSKRCPIEPSLTCDIVDECNPLAVSDSDVNVDFPRLPPHLMYGSDVFAISPRCPYLKVWSERAKRLSESEASRE